MIKDDRTLQLFCEKNDVEFTVEDRPQLGKKIYTMRRLNEAFKSVRFVDDLNVNALSFNIMVRGMLEELKKHENKEIGD